MESVPSSLIRGSSVKVLLGEGGLAGALHDVAVAVGTHPVVVEDLLQVAAAGIRGEHHHDLVLVQIIGKRVLALATAMPDEPPTSSASSPARRRVISKASASDTRTMSSVMFRSKALG